MKEGSDGGNIMENANDFISLTLEDDTELKCRVLAVFPVKEREYIALLPLDESGQETDGGVYLYRFSLSENGDPVLENIEDDGEYETAAGAFEEVVEKTALEETEPEETALH